MFFESILVCFSNLPCFLFFLFLYINLISLMSLHSLLEQVWLSSSSEKTSERQGGVRYEGGFTQEEKVFPMSHTKFSYIWHFNFISNSMIYLRYHLYFMSFCCFNFFFIQFTFHMNSIFEL